MSASGPTINLTQPAPGQGTVEERRGRAEVFALYADTLARLVMVGVIAGIFIWLNKAVMGLVSQAFDQDLAFLRAGGNFKPADRVITTQVFVSLIGATVVQVGVATVTIVAYLFPKKAGASNSS